MTTGNMSVNQGHMMVGFSIFIAVRAGSQTKLKSLVIRYASLVGEILEVDGVSLTVQVASGYKIHLCGQTDGETVPV